MVQIEKGFNTLTTNLQRRCEASEIERPCYSNPSQVIKNNSTNQLLPNLTTKKYGKSDNGADTYIYTNPQPPSNPPKWRSSTQLALGLVLYLLYHSFNLNLDS